MYASSAFILGQILGFIAIHQLLCKIEFLISTTLVCAQERKSKSIFSGERERERSYYIHINFHPIILCKLHIKYTSTYYYISHVPGRLIISHRTGSLLPLWLGFGKALQWLQRKEKSEKIRAVCVTNLTG